MKTGYGLIVLALMLSILVAVSHIATAYQSRNHVFIKSLEDCKWEFMNVYGEIDSLSKEMHRLKMTVDLLEK